MDCICVNDTYDQETLNFWKKHGVSYPLNVTFYTISEKRIHTTGEIGVILYEINNPKVPIEHPILGVIPMDVTFNIKRFRTLQGNIITTRELKNVTEIKN